MNKDLRECADYWQTKAIELQQRIDKAIEYIEYIGMEETFDKVLIEILKGE